MQVITRIATALTVVFLTSMPASAERPRPLGWAMDALRLGHWDVAGKLAARDGSVAADVIEWQRLRAGRGTVTEVLAFLERRPNWPGEAYLRRNSEEAMQNADDATVLAFYSGQAAQTPEGVFVRPPP